MKKSACILMGLSYLLPLTIRSAHAETKGPSLGLQGRSSATFERKSGSATDAKIDLKSRQQLQLHLLYPVINKETYKLVPLLDYQSLHSKNSDMQGSPGLVPDAALALGLAQVLELSSASNRYLQSAFLVARQYSTKNFKDVTPMREALLGIELQTFKEDPSLAFISDATLVTLGVRMRWYPYAKRYLPIFGIQTPNPQGFYYDLLYPSHFHLGWNFPENGWRFTTGVDILAQDFPFATDGFSGWQEGYGIAPIVALRMPLSGSIHLQLKTGLLKEFVTAYSEGGHTLGEWESKGSAFAELALQSLFP